MVTGTVLGGRYLIEEKLAAGGMGAVFRALDQKLDRPVALKVLKEELAHDERFVERFRREAQAAGALSHPNVAAVYDLGTDGDRYFIVMELAQGRDLARLLREEGRLSPDRAARLGLQIARALAHAHAAGVVHRDIKPANVIVGEGDTVKVTDFGIARAVGQSTLTAAGSVLGTAEYISPEQAEGRPVGPPADIYSFGVVLYEMLTGSVPFTGESALAVAMRHVREELPRPSALVADIPPSLERVVLQATEKDPRARFSEAREVASVLEGFLSSDGEPALAETVPMERTVWPIPGGRYDPERLGRKVLAGVAVLTLVALLLVIARLQDQSAPTNDRPARARAENASGKGREVMVLKDNVIGLPYQDVVSQLESAGLVVSTEEIASDGYEEGRVAATDPPPGSEVTAGDPVTLFLSTGPSDEEEEEDHPGRSHKAHKAHKTKPPKDKDDT
jgi:serine/threonine protein kinase